MIKIDVRGIAELQKFLKELPRGTIRVGIAAVSKYMIGDATHGLKHQPARVMHGKLNPYKWQTAKQRRAYFFTNGFGRGIPSQRTGKLAKSWIGHPTNSGYRMEIKNLAGYAQYVQGDDQQKGHRADKWRQYAQIIATNIQGAMQAANRAVTDWLRANEPK